jgi:hypothetical protein
MKIYEYNGKGNEAGPAQLQCPLCGEATIGMIEEERRVNVSIKPDGNVIITDTGNKIDISDKTIYCPQCIRSEMMPHSEVVKYHEEEHCPGCPICGMIDKQVLSTCKECVLHYNDTAINCGECSYNYSRTQEGIEISEMKMEMNIEMADIECEHQFEMFPNARRRIYRRQQTLAGAAAYEQIA